MHNNFNTKVGACSRSLKICGSIGIGAVYGGVGSTGVGNSIRGVSPYNPAYQIYYGASNLYFGPLAPYTGYWYSMKNN